MKLAVIFLAIIILSTITAGQSGRQSSNLNEPEKVNKKSSEIRAEKEISDLTSYVELNQLGVKKTMVDKDFKQAIKFFQKAVEIEPQCFICKYNLGRAYLKDKQFDEAGEIFQQLTVTNPQFADAYSGVGEILSEKKLYKESLSYYETALKLEPDDPETMTHYAMSLQNIGEYNKALKYYDRSIKLMPDTSQIYSNRGVTLFSLGRYKDALQDFNKAAELEPHAAIKNNIGVVLDKLGKKKEAEQHFLDAVKLDPNYMEAQYNLAYFYAENGKRDKAYQILSIIEKNNVSMAQQLRSIIWGKYVIDASKNSLQN